MCSAKVLTALEAFTRHALAMIVRGERMRPAFHPDAALGGAEY